MSSDNLGLPVMVENQTGKEVTFNDALAIIDSAITEVFVADVSAGNVVLTNAQFQQMARINLYGAATAGRTVTVPALKRGFIVTADALNTDAVTLVRGSTTISFPANEARMCFTDGTANGLISFAVGSVFDVSVFLPGLMTNAALAVRHVCGRPYTFPEDMLGSLADALAAPSDGDVILSLKKNGVEFGTATIANGDTTATFVSDETSFVVGDVFSVVGPALADSTMTDLALTFLGRR